MVLRGGGTGVYCGPLRLLAFQVHDALTAGGLPTNLMTGQERRAAAGARLTACTAEMAPTRAAVDVGVLDEVQLVGDPSRGWAWTTALVGAPARELYVICAEYAVDAVTRLLATCGEAGVSQEKSVVVRSSDETAPCGEDASVCRRTKASSEPPHWSGFR